MGCSFIFIFTDLFAYHFLLGLLSLLPSLFSFLSPFPTTLPKVCPFFPLLLLCFCFVNSIVSEQLAAEANSKLQFCILESEDGSFGTCKKCHCKRVSP